MNSGLTRADTGIVGLEFEEMKIGALPLDAEATDDLVEELREKGGNFVVGLNGDDAILLYVNNEGGPEVKRLVARHHLETGAGADECCSCTLPLREESDGTRRFMNLLPVLFQLREEDSQGVFIIDELENSMHPKLTENFVASFFEGLDSEDRRQLIFTTHEIQLMRSDLLRRDEIWLTDKVDDESQLTRLSDFSRDGVRKDADLLGFYMSGRIGGIPRI